MKKSHVIAIAVALSLALLVVPVAAADGVPQLPILIYGTAVDTNGQNLPVGTVITAELNGDTFSYTITEAGKIGASGSYGEKFLVSSTTTSGNIVFTANGQTASQSVSYVPGDVQQVSLVFVSGSIPVSSVQITGPIVVAAGNSVSMAVVVLPESATDKSVTWSSSNSSIASVSNGVVTGVKAGTTTITATANDGSGKSDSVTVSVIADDEEVVVPELPSCEVELNPAGEVIGITTNNSSIIVPDPTSTSAQTVTIVKDKDTESNVSIVITNVEVETTGSTTHVSLTENSVITAKYPETSVEVPSSVTSKPSGDVEETVNLGLEDANSALPVISSNYDNTVASTVKTSTLEPVAMVTGTYNAGVTESDKKVSKVTITFIVENGNSWYSNLVSNGKRVVGLHVKNGVTVDKQILTPNTDGNFVMTGTSFSSYVLAVETVSTPTPSPTPSPSPSPVTPTEPTEPITPEQPTTETPVTQQTTTTTTVPASSAKTPFPVLGILAGLGAAAFFLRRR